jgi:hypothetical protein
VTQETQKLSERTLEQAKAFLASLFMGLRTAQIHDVGNKAFDNAVHKVHDAAVSLCAATGGFSIQLVGETAFLNGARLRFDGNIFQTMRALERILSAKEIGGLTMKASPSVDGVKSLILELAKEGKTDGAALREIGILGPQAYSDGQVELRVDRKVLAVQSYAKLVLALAEQIARVRLDDERRGAKRLRLRVVRIVQDLVDLAAERPDLVVRLASSRPSSLAGYASAGAAELYGATAWCLALVWGPALELARRLIVDLAVGVLFHHLGAEDRIDGDSGSRSLAVIASDSAVSTSSMLRMITVAHHRKRADGLSTFRKKPPHLFARIASVAITYGQLVSGYGTAEGFAAAPLEALRVMMEDRSGRFDRDLVDLLVNLMRAFPVGCHVVLEDGTHAVVTSHVGSSRWDRPVVALRGEARKNLDLMIRREGRFAHRIAGTARALGREAELPEVERVQVMAGKMPLPDEAAAEPAPQSSDEVFAPADALLGAAVKADSTDIQRPKEPSGDLDELFREFLAEEKKKKPKHDTSYSSGIPEE